jgi:hypothetical protein
MFYKPPLTALLSVGLGNSFNNEKKSRDLFLFFAFFVSNFFLEDLGVEEKNNTTRRKNTHSD